MSKVDWRAADRVDPRSQSTSEFRLADMERELRGEAERAALTARAEQRLEEVSGKAPDRIHCG